MYKKIEFICNLFNSKDDQLVFLEIGANVGNDTNRFLKSFNNIEIHCFEPDPRCIIRHKKNVKDSRCTLYEMAISDIDGECDFYLSGGAKPGHKTIRINSSSIKKPFNHLKKHSWCTFNDIVKVKTMKLDTWSNTNKINNIDFIWADVQGAEENMILGGINTINKSKYFYTEFSNEELYESQINLDQIKSMLPKFEIIEIYGTNVLLKNKLL